MAISNINHIEHYSRKLLWSNDGAVAEGTTITLSDSDYDELEIHFATEITANAPMCDIRCEKGRDIQLYFNAISLNNQSDTYLMGRKLTRNSDTSFTAGNGLIYRMTGNFVADSIFVIPIKIYGIKYT